MTDLEKVELFHKIFQVPIKNEAGFPDEDRVLLRLKLLKEELSELEDACLAQDMVDASDGLADLLYILLGTVLEFGLGEVFERVFDLVHESNMTKACETEELADKTIEHYRTERGVLAYKEESENGWLVKRQGDHKVLKSVAYTKAEPLIEKLLQQ